MSFDFLMLAALPSHFLAAVLHLFSSLLLLLQFWPQQHTCPIFTCKSCCRCQMLLLFFFSSSGTCYCTTLLFTVLCWKLSTGRHKCTDIASYRFVFVLWIENQGALYNNQFNCLCGEIIRHNYLLCGDQCLSCQIHYGNNLILKAVLAVSLKFICMTVTSICFPDSFSDLDLYFKFTLVLQKIKLYGVFWKFHFQASSNVYKLRDMLMLVMIVTEQ